MTTLPQTPLSNTVKSVSFPRLTQKGILEGRRTKKAEPGTDRAAGPTSTIMD